MKSDLECPICKEPLARPLAIVPCGHIFCEDCLLQTFCTPVHGEEPGTTHATRLKQCPDCRTCLHMPPIPVYLVKNLVSTLHPEFAKDDLRSNGFGVDLGSGIPEGSDPWSILFQEDLGDVMTITSDSEAEEQMLQQQESLGTWETAVGYLSRSDRSGWIVEAEVTPENSEMSNDEEDRRGDGGSSTSSGSTARIYRIAPLFSNFPSPSSSDTGQLYLQSEEEEAMIVEQDIDEFQLNHPNQHQLIAAYKQFHRIPTPYRNSTWITRTWEPPAFVSEENEDFMTPQEKTLHQRGIPLDMQDKFQIAYTNRLGLSIQLGRGNVIFLGWNVSIFWSLGDRTGEVFMAYIRWEMRTHPERWNIHIHSDGSWDAHRLRCVNLESGDHAYASLEENGMDDSETE